MPLQGSSSPDLMNVKMSPDSPVQMSLQHCWCHWWLPLQNVSDYQPGAVIIWIARPTTPCCYMALLMILKVHRYLCWASRKSAFCPCAHSITILHYMEMEAGRFLTAWRWCLHQQQLPFHSHARMWQWYIEGWLFAQKCSDQQREGRSWTGICLTEM